MKMKKLFIILLTITLLASSFCKPEIFAETVSAVSVWNGSTDIDTNWYTSNSASNSFTISTAAGLAGLASIVNTGTDTFAGDTITLASDIDLANIEWTPIGYNEGTAITSTKQFKGSFEGNEHTISNLNIRLTSAAQYGTLGLFGTIGGGARIKDLGIKTVSVYLCKFNTMIGSLVGLVGGNATVENCFVKDMTITTSAAGTFSGVLGGLIGRAQAEASTLTVRNCYTSGIAGFAQGNWRGGIVGLVYNNGISASFTNCYTTYISFGNGANSATNNCWYATDTSSNTAVTHTTFPQLCPSNGITSEALKGYSSILGTAFTGDAYSQNSGYPILAWQVDKSLPGVPKIIGTSPDDGDDEVDIFNLNMDIVFDKYMDRSTLTAGNFEISPSVTYEVVYNSDDLSKCTIEFGTLEVNTEYTVTFKENILTYDGTAMEETSISFTTASKKKFDADNKAGHEWEQIMMVSQNLLDAGIKGGEGGQRQMSLAIDPVEGSFLLVGSDVGGILRSIDGGMTWEHANRGLYSKGGFGFSIDPNNIDRVLCVGASGQKNNISNGVYLSTDRGFSWNQVLSQPGAALGRDFRESAAFDPSSYSAKIGGSAVAYWSRPWKRQGAPSMAGINDEANIVVNPGDEKGLFKSIDGGLTWSIVNKDMADGIVKVHPTNGTVYVANLDGFHRSTDGGKTFETILDGCIIYGLDVISTKPDYVYVNDYAGVLVSSDSGKTFKRVESSNFPQSADITNPDRMVRSLKVSPKNPDNMLVACMDGINYKSEKYYSNDGGISWAKSTYDESNDFFKYNNREPVFVWHPLEENRAWSFGGDWVSSTNDGGKTFAWDHNGNNAVFVDQRTIFNIYNPDIFYYGSQDYHGALTTDGGLTWKHIWKFDGQYSGFVYGAYAADENTLIALASTRKDINGKEVGGWGGLSELIVSRDAGETWVRTGILQTDNHRKKWAEICYQSPNNPNVLFAANYRSDDYGYTWNKMANCNAVYTHNPYGDKELYGSYQNKIVVSYDDGATWKEYATAMTPEELTETPEKTEIWDMSYDGINKIMYYISGTSGTGKKFYKIQDGVTTDLTGNVNRSEWGDTFQLCAVDPRYPNVIYFGGYRNTWQNANGVQRSVDGGKTFQTLTTNTEGNSVVKTGSSGGFEPYDLIVHPKTGELWVPQGCHGWAKFAPPYEN